MRYIDNHGHLCHSDADDIDLKYGIPQLKKFPLPDAKHVKSAIKFFNYAPPRYEKVLAAAILKRMKEYGMSFEDFTVGEGNRFSKYVPSTYLAHHGIEGMKWGIRNGTNYPLKPEQYSAAEKKAAGIANTATKGRASKIAGSTGSKTTKKRGNAAAPERVLRAKTGAGGGGSSGESDKSGVNEELRKKFQERMEQAKANKQDKSSSKKGSSGSGKSGSKKGSSSGGGTAVDLKSTDELLNEIYGDDRPGASTNKETSEELTSKSDEPSVSGNVEKSVDLDKFYDTLDELLESKDEDEVTKIIKKQIEDGSLVKESEKDSFGDKEKEYLTDLLEAYIEETRDRRKSSKNSTVSHSNEEVKMYIDNYGRIAYSDELYHHGVLGQKWGVRHDHYPLDASEHTAAERKAGWRNSLEGAADKVKGAANKVNEYRVGRYYTKAANKLQKRYDKLSYKDQIRKLEYDKHADKAAKKGKDLSKKGQKALEKYTKSHEAVEKAEQEGLKLANEITAKGYKVDTRYKIKNMRKGKDVANVLMFHLAGVAMNAYAHGKGNSDIMSAKHKVRKDHQSEQKKSQKSGQQISSTKQRIGSHTVEWDDDTGEIRSVKDKNGRSVDIDTFLEREERRQKG